MHPRLSGQVTIIIDIFSLLLLLLISGIDYDERTILLTSHKGILMNMKFPNCDFSIKQIEDLIRYVTRDLRHQFVYFFTHSRFLVDGSFRLYIMEKNDFLQLPVYVFKSESQKLHLQNCLMREFYLNNKYFMNGLKPTTVPFFIDRASSKRTYVDRYITDDIVSVEFASNHQFTFPFESAHCYSVGHDILGTPILSNNGDDIEITNIIIKISERISRLQPQILFLSIYHCVLSTYREEADQTPPYVRAFF